MTTHGESAHDGREETTLEQLDRNTIELLNELRVASTGIQFMFGFLTSCRSTARLAESRL